MLSLSPKPRELRSFGFRLLSIPRVKAHTGTRAFSVAVPTLWNSLSEFIIFPSPFENSPFQTSFS